MAFRLLEETIVTPEERDLLLSLTSAVVNLCRHLEFTNTTDTDLEEIAKDVGQAWRDSQPDAQVFISRFEGDE